MNTIRWGIIGCGDVTEVKSGPAFNKVPNSELVAVMRRDEAKAKDYAFRHQVPKWYSNAHDLINDPDVNAIYIATPPLYHEEYALAALHAGKPVYVEKPMTVNEAAGRNMMNASDKLGVKLSVAHYRRQMPVFKRVKQLIDEQVLGTVRLIDLTCYKKPLSASDLERPDIQWRVSPGIAGGGLFHDLAPHQLDLMLYYFGSIKQVYGIALNQAQLYMADDLVVGSMLFQNGIVFNGRWCFSVPEEEERDECTIIGSGGKMSFSIFGDFRITINANGATSDEHFDKLMHVQQNMIEKVVDYFLDRGPNPCTASDGVEIMRIMDEMTVKPEF